MALGSYKNLYNDEYKKNKKKKKSEDKKQTNEGSYKNLQADYKKAGYKTKEAYDDALKQELLSYAFSKKDDKGNVIGGLSFDEVQAEKKKYSSDSEAYKFLSNYTNYSNMLDFDKAIEYETKPYELDGTKYSLLEVYEQGYRTPHQATTDHILKSNLEKFAPIGSTTQISPLQTPYTKMLGISNASKSMESMIPVVNNKKVVNEVELNNDYIESLKTARNKHGLDNQFDYYREYLAKEDFEEESQYKKIKNPKGNKADEVYYTINATIEEQAEYEMKFYGVNGAGGNSYLSRPNIMTEDEKKVYNYIYNTEGKKKALEYFEDLLPNLDRRNANKTVKQLQSFEDQYPILGGITASTFGTGMKIVGGITGGVESLYNGFFGEEDNPYSGAKMPTLIGSTMQQTTSKTIAEKTKGWDVAGVNVPSFLYDTGNSMVETAVGSYVFGGAYTAIAGSNSYQEKYRELTEAGEDQETIQNTALASGLAEMVFEKISIDRLLKINTSGGWKNAIKEGLKQGGVELSEELATEISNMYADELLRGDSSEFQTMRNDLRKKGYTEDEIDTEIRNEMIKRVSVASIGGFLSGAGMGAGKTMMNPTFTSNEKAVIDKVVEEKIKEQEKDDNKLSNKDKKEIRTQVEESMKRGELDIEDIEKALGKELFDAHDSLIKESEEFETLRNMPKSERSDLQDDRLAELKAKNTEKSYSDRIAESRQKISDDIDTATQNDMFIRESYNERARRGQTYQMDTNANYTEKQKAIIQKAVDYGKLNNTRKAREFVDFVAKSADAFNADFEFVDNAKLQEMKLTVEGMTINGFRDGDTVAVNLQSKKAFETVVGHEFTHLLEGTDLYDKLQSAVFNYAESKGVLADLRKNIESNYASLVEGKTDAEKKAYFDKELTADLVGDYIFTDKQFIQNLSNTQPNVAKKFLESIKRMISIATKGSAEARKLQKAKYMLEDALRERNTKAQKQTKSDDVQLSMSDDFDIDIELDRIYEEMTLEEAEALLVDIEDLIKLPSKWGLEIEETKVSKPRYKGETKTKGKVAKLTDERIEHLFNEYGASNPSYAKAYITSIHPRDFLSLTLSDESLERWDNVTKQGTDAEYRPLDVEKLKNERQTPFLEVDTETGRVTGHEGRHRMRALLEAGVTEVPIAVIDINTKNSKQKESSMRLKSQEFYKGYVNDNFKTEVKNLIPLNKVNSSEIYSTYGGKGDIQFSLSTEYDAMPKPKPSLDPTKATLQKDARSVRDIRSDVMLQNGYTESDVQTVNKFFDEMGDFMKRAGVTYQYIGLEDVNNAKLKITYDKKGNPKKIVLSAMVKNGDYPVNFDFTSICKKRQSISLVVKELAKRQTDGKRTLDVVNMSPQSLWKINEALREAGLETACLGCFVESKRYNIQNFAKKATSMWNRIVNEVRAEQGIEGNVERFNFAEGIDLDSVDYTEVDNIFKEYATQKNRTSPENRMRALIRSGGDMYQKYLSPSDLMTPEGIEAIKSLSSKKNNFYGILQGVYGQASPKEVMGFSPYNSEIALLQKTKARRKMADYIKSIGGVRMQSFSDFLVANVYDYMQMVADLSARHLPAHAYTKELAFAKIFGMTGIKINMSVMFDIDNNLPDEYAGLQFVEDENGDEEYNGVRGRFEYLVADQKRSDAEHEKTGYRPYVQSIPYDEAVALQNDERYSKNVGIIGVGYSDKHIMKMLSDDDIRYVIPYHASSLPAIIKDATRIRKATDYTDYQNTRQVTRIVDSQGNEVSFESLKNQYGTDVYRVLNDMVNNNEVQIESKSSKELAGHGKFDLYKDVEQTQNPRETANNYLQYCADNNLIPIFEQFAGHENYYKLLFDFDPYDSVTGEYAPQTEVANIYDGYNASEGQFSTEALQQMIDDEMFIQNEKNRIRNEKIPSVVDSVMEQLGMNEETDATESKDGTQYSVTDNNGRELSEAQQERFKDSVVRDENGNLLVVYHGSPSKFTVFNHNKMNANGNAHGRGFYFTENKSMAEGYKKEGGQLLEGYLDIKKPLSEDKLTMTKADILKLVKATAEAEAEMLMQDGGYDSIQEAVRDTWVSNYVDTYNATNMQSVYREVANIVAQNDTDTDIIAELTNSGLGNEITLKKTREVLGYDGVIYTAEDGTHEFVALTSEQFKSIDNVNPTSNPDINLSLSDKNQTFAPIKNGTYSQDVMQEQYVEKPIAPIKEDVKQVGEVTEMVQEEMYAPLTEEAQEEMFEPVGEEQSLTKLEAIQTEIVNLTELRKDSYTNYDKNILRLQQQYNAKKNKNTKVAQKLLMSIERTKRLRDSLDADFSKRIETLEKREKLVREGKPTTRQEVYKGIMDNMKSELESRGFNLDDVLKNAKNLSTFRTVDNTPQRVIEKTFGYKAGQVINDLTTNRTAQNETEGIKWLNGYTDRKNGLLAQISKEYGIKPNSKESASAQMYAEGFYVNENDELIEYGDRELAKDFPKVETQEKIKRLAKDERIRQIYDETLDLINESRTRNGYPEIPKRDNYYLHFRAMDDTFSKLGLPFNPNDIRAKDLPTDLNGVTADLKPGQPYFASAMQRKGNKTSYDLIGGLERYLTSAKNQIYHIDDIQSFRALRNYIADQYGQAKGLESLDTLSDEEAEARIKQVYDSHLSTMAKFLNEQANVLAGKTPLIDRGVEGVLGRRALTFLNTLNSQVGSNLVGYSASSALVNIDALPRAFAKTNKADFVKGFSQFASNKIKSIFGKGDGFAEQSPVMIRRKGAERFYRTPFQKVSDAGYVVMGAVDNVATEIIARTKYNEFIKKGMDSQKAHFETDKWVSRLMGDRSLGQMPQLFNSKTLGFITKFQLEVRNNLDSMFYDTIQEKKVSSDEIQNALKKNAKTSAKVTSTLVQLAVGQHIFGKAMESVIGYNPSFDIIGVLLTALGFDDDEESEDTALDNVEQAFLELLEDLPYTSTFTGGRIPISNALPISELITGKDSYGNEKSRLDTVKEIAPYYILPGGYGQIKKTYSGLKMFDDDLVTSGSYTNSGDLRFPVEDTLPNRIQAGLFGQYANENAREYFDNNFAPLNPKQTQEYVDLDIPIKDYWKYREGLKEQKTVSDKYDYITGLDHPISKKNIMFNNVVDRDEEVDLTGYEDYSSYEEFDFATKNSKKYKFLKENNISYEKYSKSAESKEAYGEWAYENPTRLKIAKATGKDVVKYREYNKAINKVEGIKDAKGNTISGTKKTNIIKYINNLNTDYYTKIILFTQAYPKDDTYKADILSYVNSKSNLTYKDKVDVLTELGFTISSDGRVRW